MLQFKGVFPEGKEIIAIVGPRAPSENGLYTELAQHKRDCQVAYQIARMAAKKGIVVLSGLASGIDTAAHQGCLDEGGITVAVLPFGLDARVYPPENLQLTHRILTNSGCLVSQFKPEQLAAKWTFIARDKTQALLSHKIFVVGTFPPEGIIIGGTKHCAHWARKIGKPLYHYRQINNQYRIFENAQVLIDKLK